MEITNEQYKRIEGYLPVQRGNVKVDNLTLINAILYIAENGCKWRSLPKEYGKWYTIYKRVNRWAKSGVLERVFLGLQKEQLANINVEILAIDSTCRKVHPDGTGALKKTENKVLARQKADGAQSFMWFPQMLKLS